MHKGSSNGILFVESIDDSKRTVVSFVAGRFADGASKGVRACRGNMAKFVAVETGEVVALSCFVSRAVASSEGSDLTSVVNVEGFRSETDIRWDGGAETHTCSASAIFNSSAIVLAAAEG